MSKIRVMKNGPLIVEGFKEMPVLELTGINGEMKNGKKFAFCRCGHSLDKVFCDGSHINYKIDEQLQTISPERV